MQKHLGTACKRCMETMAQWQKIRNTAAREASYQPPVAAVRIAKAAFAAAGRATQEAEKRGFVQVLFDSFLQPLVAGAPSRGLGTRQMVYRADPYPIDVQIEAKAGGKGPLVTDQCL